MAAGNNAQTLALQFERVRDKISLLFARDDTFFSKLKKRGDVEIVSTRNMRIPLQLVAGGNFQQSDMDNGDLGVGTSTKFDFAVLSPVFFTSGTQFSKEAEYATNSNEKALENYAKIEVENSLAQFNTQIEAVLQGDGSGTVDTVVSTGSQQVVVTTPNQFSDQCTYQVFSAVGGTNRGNIVVAGVDVLAKTVYTVGALPGGTIAGDIIVVAGGSGAAASSVLGLKYHQFSATSGSWLGLNRATYPGKLNSANVDLGSESISPAYGRLAIQKIRTALGADTPEAAQVEWYMNVDQEAAIENNALAVQMVIKNMAGNAASVDMGSKKAPKTFMDLPMNVSIHASAGRLDLLALKHWGRGEILPLDFLEWGGQTMFPTYGSSGGLNASTLFYYGIGFNVFTDNPRAGAYLSNAAVPDSY